MRRLLFLLPLVLVGCAQVHSHKYVAPSAVPISQSISGARVSAGKASVKIKAAEKIVAQVPTNTSPAIKELSDDLTAADVAVSDTDAKLAQAQTQIATYQAQVQTLTENANKEVDSYNALTKKYNHALKQLWSWRFRGLFCIFLSIFIFAGTIIWKLGLFGVRAAAKAVIP